MKKVIILFFLFSLFLIPPSFAIQVIPPYNSANQLTKEEQVVGKGAIPIKTIDYGYDGNGNQVLKYMSLRPRAKRGGKQSHPKGEAISSFAYDPENRLTGITYTSPYVFRKGTRSNSFTYCPFGKRIYKSDSLGDTYYFYDGDNILLELDAQNRTLARYTTGLSIDEWISKTTYSRKKAKTIYYHYDGLGSVVALTDEKGNVVEKYNYSPFGTLVPEGIASSYLSPVREKIHNYFPHSRRNTITYTGREYDPDSGLYFYRARYYDSRVGRFLQKDPIRSVNPYVYVGNNPIRYTDPTGYTLSEALKKISEECDLKCKRPIPVGDKMIFCCIAIADYYLQAAGELTSTIVWTCKDECAVQENIPGKQVIINFGRCLLLHIPTPLL